MQAPAGLTSPGGYYAVGALRSATDQVLVEDRWPFYLSERDLALLLS